MWQQIALWVVMTIVSYLLQPKPEQPNAALLDDFDIPTADETRSIPVLFGTREIKDSNVVHYGDLYTKAIYKKGGKK